ncbi:other/SCY1 protein kinase [Amanita rubescens]|nr:other/SCY1 protein kinase [Amanita rubescens]
MLAAATSFFSRTVISQSYNVGNIGSRPTSPGSSGSQAPAAPFVPTLLVGLWKVQPAYHKITNKRVSVWTCDKRGPDMDRSGTLARERMIEVLKSETSALSRLRHPSILEMVEPLEETRSELIFATEPILSSLELSIPGSGRRSPVVELDEVEIQKGILQICKGLSFLHSSAQLVHSNISPESIIINSAGDWKISGLGLTIPLLTNGAPTRWEFPTYDGRLPPYIQRSFDYMAPEYALDEQLVTASDMYSLGCLIYAVHCKGNPPFKNHGNLGSLRDSAGKTPTGLDRLDPDVQALLRSLFTRHASNRPTPTTLPSHPFFSSLPISTLNFLDRSNFTAKTREEKISFMKGLTKVLDRFSIGLRTRKILPSLLEEMKDTHLLPHILPNVFSISNDLTATQFASMVLPSLRPLFAVKEPPQNMLTLLDNLSLLQNKTEKAVFREQVLPLVYNALESEEHAVVQERALKVVPDLCETIDYAEVQGVLFPHVAFVFSKTRVLSVKVATLGAFLTMVKTLDQASLTQKLVPLLSKIRTKEPAVMMATLSVQEAMGFKVDREAVANLVLPQLWSMSIGPLLNVEQFHRFMTVIRRLGERVEKEHDQFLRDAQRIEDRSALAANSSNTQSFASTVDFENLVGRSGGVATNSDTVTENKSWEDNVWGSIFDDNPLKNPTPLASPTPPIHIQTHVPLESKFEAPSQPGLGARKSWTLPPPLPATFNSTEFRLNRSPPQGVPFAKPNYNISLARTPIPPTTNVYTRGSTPLTSQNTGTNVIQPSMASILTPSKPAQMSSNTIQKFSKDDWGDFDPLA